MKRLRSGHDNNKISTPNTVTPPSLFGPPPVLVGEDGAAYDELSGRIYAAVKPSDVIDEMFIDDVVFLEWDVLRWRRVKSSIIRELRREALDYFLRDHLSYPPYRENFEQDLAEILQENLEDDRPADAIRKLARDCANNSREAVNEVNNILNRIDMRMDQILDDAKRKKAEELVRDYGRGKSSAVELIDKLLAEAAVSIDDLMADYDTLRDKLDLIERVDRLISIAEARRNDSLHEIERRRAALGEKLRRRVQEIEDAEFHEAALDAIEAPPIKESDKL